jgi:hypothetical protein
MYSNRKMKLHDSCLTYSLSCAKKTSFRIVFRLHTLVFNLYLALFLRVDAELKPWAETGITRQMLDNLWRCDNGEEKLGVQFIPDFIFKAQCKLHGCEILLITYCGVD